MQLFAKVKYENLQTGRIRNKCRFAFRSEWELNLVSPERQSSVLTITPCHIHRENYLPNEYATSGEPTNWQELQNAQLDYKVLVEIGGRRAEQTFPIRCTKKSPAWKNSKTWDFLVSLFGWHFLVLYPNEVGTFLQSNLQFLLFKSFLDLILSFCIF